MEAHRGTIQVRSDEGKGTQVRLEFPVPGGSKTTSDKLMVHSTIS
jgi:signal transduction histidine kinase